MKRTVRRFAKWVMRVFFGLFICNTATFLILGPILKFHKGYVPLKKRQRSGHDRLAIIFGIIPDQSHHFIYRELAHLKKIFNFKLYSLLKGDDKYSTSVTDYLIDGITYMPARYSGSQYLPLYLCYLKYLVLHPVKVANLLRLYENDLGGRLFRFVDHKSVEDIFHPLHGFYFADLLKKQSIGHIHSYCTHIPTNLALVAAHLLDVSFSFTGYADFDFYYPHKMIEEKLRLCDFATVHTNFCKERMLGYTSEKYRDKIHLVRFGLDIDSFKPQGHSGSKKLRLLCIGGLVPKKGHRYLIKACEILRDKGIDFDLLLIGHGPLLNSLKELTSFLKLDENIAFLGAVPNDKLAQFYTTDTILVQPSVYAADGERDGIPTVIPEAMVMGVAVISTYVSGIPEAVKNRQNGLLVIPEDYRALADVIMELHSDEELRRRIVENGKITASELFDNSRWIPKLESLLRNSLRSAESRKSKTPFRSHSA